MKEPRPRIPMEAALRLRSHPVEPRKGRKGYNRRHEKNEDRENVGNDTFEESS